MATAPATGFIENRTYDEIRLGDSATGTRTLTLADIQLFAIVSGDVNPAHLDPEYARGSMFGEVIGHGLWGGALISSLLGNELPGPGTIYVSQSLRFSRPVKVGDTLTVTVTCTRKVDEKKRVVFDCLCANQHGKTVISGEAEVLAPTAKVRRPWPVLPAVSLSGMT
jgi:acyl dehydratase